MGACPRSQKLLNQVWWRLFVARLAWRAYWLGIAFWSVYGVLLLCSRLTGLIPDVFDLWTVVVPGVLALVLAMAWPSRIKPQDAARSIDRIQQTRDLFLTLTLLDRSAGEYQPLVARDAERRAALIKSPAVVPFQWKRRLLSAVSLAGALFAGIGFLPTWDPFGKVAQASQVAAAQRRLVESKKATEIRRAQLKEQDLDQGNSPDVEKALERLKVDLKSMRREQPRVNQQKLAIDQKQLGEKFRVANEAVKTLMNQGGVDQKFGEHSASEFKKWQKELAQGSSEGMSKEIEQLKQDLEALARTEDPIERAELQRKVERRLKALADFASEKSGSKGLTAALERAKEQMQAAKSDKALSTDALEAMQDTLDLAQMELQQVAQSANDLKSLEEALETLAMAKKLNQDGKLEGGAMTDALSAMEEYKELYQELLAQMGYVEGEGDGDGTGGEGMGNGGDPGEDDSIKTDFVSEQTKTPIQKGKILLSMKQKGLSESGEAHQEFQQLLNDVKQGYSEAIDAEQIPPGYHEGIKSYFDTLGRSEAPPEAASTAP